MFTHETKLDSSADWEHWRWQFQSLTRATGLWQVVQDLQISLEEPEKPEFSQYQKAVILISSTSSQFKSQSTVQQEIPIISTRYAHLLSTGKQKYTAAYVIFDKELKLYNIQQQKIQKLIEFIHQTVSSAYLENCCNLKYNLDIWFVNLKNMTGTFISQEFINIRNWYNKAIQFLMKIKNYKKWIIKWKSIINYIQSKKVRLTMKLLK